MHSEVYVLFKKQSEPSMFNCSPGTVSKNNWTKSIFLSYVPAFSASCSSPRCTSLLLYWLSLSSIMQCAVQCTETNFHYSAFSDFPKNVLRFLHQDSSSWTTSFYGLYWLETNDPILTRHDCKLICMFYRENRYDNCLRIKLDCDRKWPCDNSITFRCTLILWQYTQLDT